MGPVHCGAGSASGELTRQPGITAEGRGDLVRDSHPVNYDGRYCSRRIPDPPDQRTDGWWDHGAMHAKTGPDHSGGPTQDGSRGMALYIRKRQAVAIARRG